MKLHIIAMIKEENDKKKHFLREGGLPSPTG